MTAEQVRREFDAELLWMPFDLHPEYPPEGITLAQLRRGYGMDPDGPDPTRARFEAAGLVYNRQDVVPNTRLALRLGELAREHGLHEQFHDRLMDAYWAEAVNIGDPDELRMLAAEVGLDATEVERVISDPDAYLDLVLGSTSHAISIGVTGVPSFLLDRRLLIVGAQPLSAFRQGFAQLAG